jgi:hypothetical protein
VAYRELSKEPIIGAGTDIAISTTGYVASYLTDANDPDVLSIPGGNFNCEFYFSVNNNTGNPTTYAELYKYDGTTFTILGSSVGVPEYINQGTIIAPYYFAIPVATAALALTDRLAIRIYVNVDGRTVTLHTENGHLCQVVTTLSKGMVSLNNLTDQSQFITTGTSGTNFAIVSSGDTHTFNLPVASATNTGKLSSTDWSTFNGKLSPATADATYLALAGGTMTGQIVLKEGTTSTDFTKGLRFPNDPYGGSGDTSGLRLYADTATGAESQILELYVTNDGTGVSQDKINFLAPSNDFVMVNGNKIWNAGNLASPQSAITLTTTGNSGSSTFASNTLNIPTYTITGLGGLPLTGGTLTGALGGTTASFTGAITAQRGNFNQGASSGYAISMQNRNANQEWGLIVDTDAVDDKNLGLYSSAASMYILRIAASTGAATFFSNITSNNSVTINRFSNGDYLALKIENRPITAGNNGVGFIAFFSNKADATSDTFTSGKIYGKFDSDSYNAARITLSTVTGNNIYQDVLTAKDTNVGIGTINPAQTLHLFTTSATANGVGTAIQIQSAGTGANQAWVGVNKGTGNGLTFSVENNSIIFNTGATTPFGGTERFRITSTDSTFSGALNVNGLINNTYSNNSFLGLNIRNTNTGDNALSGISIQNSGGTTVGQINYVSTVYANPTLRNTLLINTVFDNKLAFGTNSGGGATRADIYFTVNPAFTLGASNPNQIHILGSSRNVIINYSGTDYGANFQVNGTTRLSAALTGTSATFSDTVTAKTSFTTAGTNANPVFEDWLMSNPNGSSTLTKIQVGNSFASSTGTWMKFSVNSNIGGNTPVDVLTLKYDATATFSGNMGIGGISSADIIGYGTNGILGILGAPGNPASIQLGVTGTAAATTTLLGDINVFGLNGSSSVVARTIIRSALDGATNSTKMDFFTMNGGSLASRLTIASTGAATFSNGVTAYGLVATDGTYQTQIGVMGTDGYLQALKSSDASATNLRFYTGINERMRITAAGNVGIGTTSPVNYTNYRSLHISGATSTSSAILYLTNSTETIRGLFFAEGAAQRITIGSQSDHPLTFIANDAERMRITSGGKGELLVGTSSASGWSSANRGLLELNGGSSGSALFGLKINDVQRAYFYHNNSNLYIENMLAGASVYVISISGGVYLAANATSWTSNSDERLKNINSNIDNALSKLMTLRAVNFSWKTDETNKENLGLIAQDVEKVFPQVIDKNKLPSKPDKEQTDETEYLGVRYQELVPVLIAAIQEQQAQIEELRQIVATK